VNEADWALTPWYGVNTLADLISPIAARLGFADAADSQIEIPPAQQYVLVLVDGMGELIVGDALEDAPYLAQLWEDRQSLTACFPSTTAASLSSLYSGLPPAVHGIVGYSFRWKPGALLNALTWADGPQSPETFQPHPTWFERLGSAGVPVSYVTLAKFANSGLTRASMRGASMVSFEEEHDYAARAAQIAALAKAEPHGLILVYERQLDHSGHKKGVASPQWRNKLSRIDEFLGMLRDQLSDSTRLVVTGDHGMVDVNPGHKIVFEDEPQLNSDVELFGGEPRMRHLYTDSPDQVAQRWSRFLGDRAWVLTRQEAAERQLFGARFDPGVDQRIGDVLVVMRSDWVICTQKLPGELRMTGMHGSLTPQEMRVPLLIG
jgi:predicted AlkP superfamily pyrophosphatase or phosphodiesterase